MKLWLDDIRPMPKDFDYWAKTVERAKEIIRALDNLLNSSLEPDEFFIEFEKIHPYNDGNGRVGEIIYYLSTGSFNCPNEYFKS